MNILKYEYKAHRLIKIIFYLISFVLGFLIGVGVKELKINSILCTLLGIENVQAKTLTVDYTDTFTVIRKNYDLDDRLNYLEENFIKPKFNKVFNQYAIVYIDGELYVFLANGTLSSSIFNAAYGDTWINYYWSWNVQGTGSKGYFKIPLDSNFEEIVTSLSSYDTMSSDWLLDYSSKSSGSMIVFSSYYSNALVNDLPEPSKEYYIPYNIKIPMFLDGSHPVMYSIGSAISDKHNIVVKYFDKEYTLPSCFSGGCVSDYEELPSYYEYLSEDIGYFKDPEFNENLFANNDNFYQYCAKSGSSYAITRTDNPKELEYMTDYDYIWFPYGLNGIHISNYSNNDISILNPTLDGVHLDSDNIFEFKNVEYDFFKDKDTIKSIIADNEKIENYKFKGYTDMYSYYGWSSLLFLVWFDYRDGNNFNFFPIIDFNSLTKFSIGSSGTLHGGGGRVLDDKGNVDKEETNYCFYIKKDYVVTEIYKDAFGDYYGDVPTQDGDFSFETHVNEHNYGSDTSFGSITNFITNIGEELGFIKDTVLDFFRSMPTLLQLFILAIFNILLIKVIIGMVTR